MGRPRGSKNKNPTVRKPSASKATQRAQASANADMSNGVNAEAARTAFDRLKAGHAARLSIMGSAMNDCRQEHAIDKEALDTAKGNGVPLRALKANFKLWVLEQKKVKIVSALEPDDAALLELVQRSLGQLADLPLGQAAVSAATRGAKAVASIAGINGTHPTARLPPEPDLAKRSDRDAEAAAANKAALEAGIKPFTLPS